jgi:hypothetical protein
VSLFNFLHPKSEAEHPTGLPPEPLFAVPIAARKLTSTGAVPRETYMFYAFLFDKSGEQAVARLRKDIRDDGFEFIELTGQVSVTTISDWEKFVSDRFDWMKNDLPTRRTLEENNRGVIYYSPKITRY